MTVLGSPRKTECLAVAALGLDGHRASRRQQKNGRARTERGGRRACTRGLAARAHAALRSPPSLPLPRMVKGGVGPCSGARLQSSVFSKQERPPTLTATPENTPQCRTRHQSPPRKEAQTRGQSRALGPAAGGWGRRGGAPLG